MIRRSPRLLSPFLALVLIALVAGQAFAYGNVNPSHLRLSRLDPLACATPIGIQATLTDRKGDPIAGATIQFSIHLGEPGDALAPASDVTDAQGRAVTYLTLVCTDDTHHIQVLATGPDGAKARINLVLHKDRDDDVQGAAGIPSVTTGASVAGGGLTAAAVQGLWRSLR